MGEERPGLSMVRKRVQVLTAAWSEIMVKNLRTRKEVVEVLKGLYEKFKVEPIRGASNPPDLYDKDMASLYAVGKWGLGLDKELPEDLFNAIFPDEIAMDKMLAALREADSRDALCSKVGTLCEKVNDSFIARFLRFVFTLYYFGFTDRKVLLEVLKKVYNFFPELQETVRRFAKFVVAYEVCLKMASGSVKSRLKLDLARNLAALEIGVPKAVPSFKYMVEVCKHFFKLPTKLVESLKGDGRSAGEGEKQHD